MTLSIMTLSIMTLSIMTLSIKTLSILTLIRTTHSVKIKTAQQYNSTMTHDA